MTHKPNEYLWSPNFANDMLSCLRENSRRNLSQVLLGMRCANITKLHSHASKKHSMLSKFSKTL
ncbi:unnamed protein product [Moneuplotes crassus]|uniref:Uncharacterized protein n=1 Tax=Euplotes crassus TaxID=5936 RepID=A0AAD1XUF0_EUPCR|nr:unnamed protein product [Moneuplotes crassus]